MVVVLMRYEDCVYVLEAFGFDVNWVYGEGFSGGFQKYSSVLVEPNEEDSVFFR